MSRQENPPTIVFKALERFRTSVLKTMLFQDFFHIRVCQTAFSSIPAQTPSRVVRGGVPRRSRRRPEGMILGRGDDIWEEEGIFGRGDRASFMEASRVVHGGVRRRARRRPSASTKGVAHNIQITSVPQKATLSICPFNQKRFLLHKAYPSWRKCFLFQKEFPS